MSLRFEGTYTAIITPFRDDAQRSIDWEAYEKIHAQAGLEKLHVQTNGLDVETVLKVNGQKVDDKVIYDLQSCVDSYGKGDLIRGFWRKPA